MSKVNGTSAVTYGGAGLFELMFIVFLILKLVPGNPVNDWSWWLVTAPLWAPIIIVILIALVVFLIMKVKHDI